MSQVIINISSSGDNTIVAGVAGQTIKVYRLEMYCNAAVAVTIKSGASTTLVPAQSYGAGAGKILDASVNGEPWYTCNSGDALVFNLGGAVQVSGAVWYVQS